MHLYTLYIYVFVCVVRFFKSIESLWVSTWKGCTKPLFPKRQDKAGEVEYAVFMSHFESVLGPVTPSDGKPRRDFGRPRMVFPWSENLNFRFGKSELVPQPGWSKMLWHFDGIFYQILGADRKWWIPKTVAFLTNMLIHWMEGTQDFGNLQQIPWNPIKSPLNHH